MAEKYYSISPYVYCLNNPIIYIDLFGREPTFEEAARMAAHVYGDYSDDILIGGWTKIIDIKEQNTGFKSALYSRRKENGNIEFTCAFAGTDTNNFIEILRDSSNDILQLYGLSPQYYIAAILAHYLDKTISKFGDDNNELTFVGHSLGGGMSALSSMLTGRKAITFNPARVSNDTKHYYSLDCFSSSQHKTSHPSFYNILNYVIHGEILDILQHSTDGKTKYLFLDSNKRPLKSHSIDRFLEIFISNLSEYKK
jgi:hypothetical protein